MDRIEWQCDGCGDPVEDGAGYIEVLAADRAAYARELREWEQTNTGPLVPAGAILTRPRRAPWHVWHRVCDPNPEAPSYWFTVERARDTAAALQWTLHLMDKRWISSTDWTTFLARQTAPTRTPESLHLASPR